MRRSLAPLSMLRAALLCALVALAAVRAIADVGVSLCTPGDGTTTTLCPCASGQIADPGHGCGNSVFTGGAILTATGSDLTAGADDVTMTASSMPFTVSACILLQGSIQNPAGAVFNDGVLCIANPGIIRVYGTNVKSDNGCGVGCQSTGGDDLLVDGSVQPEQGIAHPLVWARAIALRITPILPRLVATRMRLGEDRDHEIVRALREQRPDAGSLARCARDEPLHDRAVVGGGSADHFTDLLAWTERAPDFGDGGLRLRGECQWRIVRVCRPLAHLKPGHATRGLGVGRIEHQHRAFRACEPRPEGGDTELAGALQLETVRAGHRLPEEMEAVPGDGDSREDRGPDAVLEQQLPAVGPCPRAARHERRHRGKLSLARPALEEVGIGGVEAEEDDGTGGAISWHDVGMQWASAGSRIIVRIG